MKLIFSEKRKVSVREVDVKGLLKGYGERVPVAQDGPWRQLPIILEEHQEFQNMSLSEHCEVIWEQIFKCSPGRFCLVYRGFSEGVDQSWLLWRLWRLCKLLLESEGGPSLLVLEAT